MTTSSTRLNFFALLQLLRVPNTFTAFADVIAGFAWGQAALRAAAGDRFNPNGLPLATGRWPELLILCVASACLYSAGMVLNDLFDVEQDRAERPHRPIPSGRISPKFAERLGWGLLAAGCAAALAAGMKISALLPFPIALSIAAMVVFYDRFAKRFWMGPPVMGTCRGLNFLLGVSARGTLEPQDAGPAMALLLYIAGVTWFARTEAKVSSRLSLTGGMMLAMAGLATLGCTLMQWAPWGAAPLGPATPLWVFMLAFPFIRRGVQAIFTPQPRTVQMAVQMGILSLPLLDACIAYSAGGLTWAIAVLLLIPPTLLLGRLFYST